MPYTETYYLKLRKPILGSKTWGTDMNWNLDTIDFNLEGKFNSIKNFSDVSNISPSDNQILIFNTTNGEWTPGSITLGEISDVNSSGSDGQVLTKQSDGSNAFETISITSNQITDINSSGSEGQVLVKQNNGSLALETLLGGIEWSMKTTSNNSEVLSNMQGVICDTTNGSFSLLLPVSPSIGETIGFSQFDDTFSTNSFSIDLNGNTYEGLTGSIVVPVNVKSVILLFVGGNKGWTTLSMSSSEYHLNNTQQQHINTIEPNSSDGNDGDFWYVI